MRWLLFVFVLVGSALFLGAGGVSGPGMGSYRTVGGMPPSRPIDTSPARSVFHTSVDGTTVVRDLSDTTAAGPRHMVLSIAADGQCTLLITVNGARVFEGPCTTDVQRAKVPAEPWMALRLAYYQHELGMPDGDEWTVLGNKIARVLELQDQLDIGFDADPRHTPAKLGRDDPLAQAAEALTQGTSPGPTGDNDLKAAVTRFHDARKKTQDGLVEAQRSLQRVITLRQEAILIRLGLVP
jgi:hypothetical protein